MKNEKGMKKDDELWKNEKWRRFWGMKKDEVWRNMKKDEDKEGWWTLEEWEIRRFSGMNNDKEWRRISNEEAWGMQKDEE